MDLMVTTICHSAAVVPVAVSLLFEQVLCELSHYDAQKLVHIISNFVLDQSGGTSGGGISGINGTVHDTSSCGGDQQQVKLLSLRVLSASMRFVTSAQLLQELGRVIPPVVASVSSAQADLRKAAIFVLVEVYMVVGDALYPFTQSLSPPQRKLLTIYVDRKLKQRSDGLML